MARKISIYLNGSPFSADAAAALGFALRYADLPCRLWWWVRHLDEDKLLDEYADTFCNREVPPPLRASSRLTLASSMLRNDSSQLTCALSRFISPPSHSSPNFLYLDSSGHILRGSLMTPLNDCPTLLVGSNEPEAGNPQEVEPIDVLGSDIELPDVPRGNGSSDVGYPTYFLVSRKKMTTTMEWSQPPLQMTKCSKMK